MSKREIDLGRLAQKVGRRIEDEGQATSQRFHDWKRTEQIETDSTRGGRGVPLPDVDRAGDRQAARLAARWLHVRVQLEALLGEANYLMDEAKAANVPRIKDWTPAQAEAEGRCGSCWRIGKDVPVQCRPTGEPYVRGRCRFCRGWPDHMPSIEDLKTHHEGRTVWVPAS